MTPRKDEVFRILFTNSDDNEGEKDKNEKSKEDLIHISEFGINRLPETEQESDQVNEILANEIDNLSIVEKEKITFDVHGIPQVYDDCDPSDVDEILQQLEYEIENIEQKDEYNLAKVRHKRVVYFCASFRRFESCHQLSLSLVHITYFCFWLLLNDTLVP